MLLGWAPAHAQDSARSKRATAEEQETIVVTAQRPVGAAIGNPEPERQLDEADIATYGADNVRELVDALSLEARGSSVSGGPTVVLLNGRRIASFSEIGDIPPEAVLRVDILSEEVGRRYGYPVSSKVLNIVLRPNYSTRVADVAYSQATAGGRSSPEGNFTIARNGSGLRWNLNFAAAHNEPLLESERDIRGGFGDFRSLLPGLDRFSINGTAAKDQATGISYTANARAEVRRTLDLTGPSSIAGRTLRRERNDLSARLGGSARGEASGWQWQVTSDAQFVASKTRGERASAPAYLADVERIEFNLEGLANRTIAQLPAGEAGLSLRMAFGQSSLRSRSSLSPASKVELDRSRGTAFAGLDLPLSSRRQGRRGVGDLTLGLTAEAFFDDFHNALFRLDSSLNWSPVPPLTIGLGFNYEEDAPTLEDLGNPVVMLDNVTLFDFTRGETAVVRLRTGGNPSLGTTGRETLRAGLTWRPVRGLNLSATWTRTRAAGLAGPFPAITREVEQAFPARFVRDASGRLVEVDQTPVEFRREARDQFRWGFNWNQAIVRRAPASADVSATAMEMAAAQVRNGGLNVSIFHTVRLRDDLLVREGLPRLDFLKGSVAGIGGGRARHLVEVQATLNVGGFGAQLNGSILGGSRVTATSGQVLRFSPVSRFDLRLFADLGQMMPRQRWATGTRVSLQFGNLLDSRVRVRTAAGTVPEAFQSAYLEPLGRTIRFGVRRVF
jgi:hypothetical protein